MRVAIVGGIGSGKSAVIDYIKSLGYVTCKADEINAELFGDKDYVRLLFATFPGIQKADGTLDKAELRRQVFSDKAKRFILNSISHPRIKAKIMAIESDPLFVEIPLLIESNMGDCFEEVIYVKTRKSKRLKRLMSRPDMSVKMALKIMNAQKADKMLISKSTIILDNNGSEEQLKKAVDEICDYLLSPKDEKENDA